MYMIIAGYSIFTVQFIKEVDKKNNKILVVVEEKDKAQDLSMESNIITINGSPSDPKVLDELNLDKCDVFISATNDDETNILSALYAKDAGVQKIFVKITKTGSASILNKLNIVPINPEEFAATSVELRISRPIVQEIVTLGAGGFDIVEKQVDLFENLIGKMLFKVRSNFFVAMAVHKDGKYLFLPETIIEPNATVIILVETGKEKDLEKALKMYKELDIHKLLS